MSLGSEKWNAVEKLRKETSKWNGESKRRVFNCGKSDNHHSSSRRRKVWVLTEVNGRRKWRGAQEEEEDCELREAKIAFGRQKKRKKAAKVMEDQLTGQMIGGCDYGD